MTPGAGRRLTLLAVASLAMAVLSCSALSTLVTDGSPLPGRWREVAWIDCASGQEAVPEEPIRELRFRTDGSYTVTWVPFETYVDYRGTYTTSDTGSIELTIDWSAYAPTDFDGTGSVMIDKDGTLLLSDVWLGSPKNTRGENGCGHRFERYGD